VTSEFYAAIHYYVEAFFDTLKPPVNRRKHLLREREIGEEATNTKFSALFLYAG
jgi:hypothetical protein